MTDSLALKFHAAQRFSQAVGTLRWSLSIAEEKGGKILFEMVPPQPAELQARRENIVLRNHHNIVSTLHHDKMKEAFGQLISQQMH